MAETILITSGKGGVGKSTICANLGRALAKKGFRVCLFDFDFGLNSLDAICAVNGNINYDIIDAVNNRCRLKQAIIQTEITNLFLLESTHSFEYSQINPQNIKLMIDTLSPLFDYFLIDCPAGIDSGFHRACCVSNSALVVVTPYSVSVRDADKVLSILRAYEMQNVSVIINRMRGDLVSEGKCLSHEDVSAILKCNIKGVIPECDSLLTNCITEDNSAYVNKVFNVLADNITDNKSKIIEYYKQKKFFSFKRNCNR